MSQKHLLLVLSTAVISGFSIFFNSIGVTLANPSQYTFVKNLIPVFIASSILFFPFHTSNFRSLSKKHWVLLVAIGFIGGAVPFVLFFEGLAQAGGGAASFIHKTLFLWVAIFAPFLLKEKVKLIFFIPACSLLVANFLLLPFSFHDISRAHLFIVSATILWAVEAVISKYVISCEVKPLVVIWSRMTFGSVFLFAYLLLTDNLPHFTDFSPTVLMWLLISGTMLTGYVFTWYFGLSRVPVTLASSLLLLGAPITLVLSTLFKGKPITGENILGILITVLSVIFLIYLFYHSAKTIGRSSATVKTTDPIFQ